MAKPKVKVHRTEQGTVVESPCACFGYPFRVHSTPNCPWQKARDKHGKKTGHYR